MGIVGEKVGNRVSLSQAYRRLGHQFPIEIPGASAQLSQVFFGYRQMGRCFQRLPGRKLRRGFHFHFDVFNIISCPGNQLLFGHGKGVVTRI